MKNLVIAAAMSLCLAPAAPSSADTLILSNGTRVDGTVVGIVAGTITFRSADGVSRRYSIRKVSALEFLSAEQARPRGVDNRRFDVPAGTELTLRTVEAIDSRNAGPEQTFPAIVEQAVADRAGRVIIPERSRAELVIRQMSSGGSTGSPEMVLDVYSLIVEGRRYLVSTTDLALESETGIGKNRRTAETVGGGALLGTIIGAIAGGGKGAAIGGVVGAAGGAGAQVFTRGHDVRVPAETVLKFRLDRPVTLQPER